MTISVEAAASFDDDEEPYVYAPDPYNSLRESMAVWTTRDAKTTRQAGDLQGEQETPCPHTETLFMYIDLDEIGEWDFMPHRVIICLGCEAVRWV